MSIFYVEMEIHYQHWQNIRNHCFFNILQLTSQKMACFQWKNFENDERFFVIFLSKKQKLFPFPRY